MFQRHKQPSLEAALLIILVVISVFGLGYYSENKVTGMAVKESLEKKSEGLEKVTGRMVKITGMDTAGQTYKAKITTTGPEGEPKETIVDLGTSNKEEAQEKINQYRNLPGVTISGPYSSSSYIPISDTYEAKNLGTEENPTWVVIGGENTWLPDNPTNQQSANALADKLKEKNDILNAYNEWRISQNNLPNTVENRKLFRDHPPDGINNNLIDATLGLTAAEEAEEAEQLAYKKIKLPDETYVFQYKDKNYFGDESGNPPKELQDLLDLEEKLEEAKGKYGIGNPLKETTLDLTKDDDDPTNQLWKGKDGYYIYEDGEFKKLEGKEYYSKEKIGDTEYTIKHITSDDGKKSSVNSIKINDRFIDIDQQTLKELKQQAGLVGEGADIIRDGDKGIKLRDSAGNVYYETTINNEGNRETITHQWIEQRYDSDEDGKITEEDETRKVEVSSTKIIYKTEDGKRTVIGSERTTLNYDDLGEFTYSETLVFNDKGDITEYIHQDKEGIESKFDYKTGNCIGTCTEEGKTRFGQFKSRQWFSNLEFKLTQFKGLAGWSQLIFSDEELARWREGVDKLFSSLYLGTDYWVSGICSKHIPKDLKGTFTMKTKDGLFDVVAHVEGERTTIENPNGTVEYLYKLTFSVRNPKYSRYDKLKFNVYLYGDRTVKLYAEDIEVKDGDSFTRGAGKRENGQTTYDEQHGKPIVQYSNFLYDRICIKFDHYIINAEGDREDEVCNAIVEYKGSPTKYEQRAASTGALGTPTTPTEPYQEADF